jgi:Aldehyde dehydrogenase family
MVTSRPPTERAAIDAALTRLRDNARRFTKLSLDERATLCRTMQAGMLEVAAESVRAACQAKGIPLGGSLEGEEWALGPWMVVRNLRLTHESLVAIKRTGTTPVGPAGRTADGRLFARCFPASGIDAALFRGVRVDAHLQPGIAEHDLAQSRARFYHAPHEGRVAGVLGAGNVNAIVSQDVITKMFNEGTVCALKMNPVNAYLGPYLERAYAAAIREGFLAVLYGGTQEGAYLVEHAAVDEIHITGSDRTFDRIVWGAPGPERDRRRAEGRPLLAKPITAELGNVSPVITVPGPYSDAELAYQAEDIASAVTYNASFDCNAAKVLITPKGWAGREPLLRGIEAAFAKAPPRPAYYAGARERWEHCIIGRRDVRRVGALTADVLPWTLCAGLDPDATNDPGFRQESFCPVLFETSVDGADPIEFLDQAVAFANSELWGTLNATVVVHSATLRDAHLAARVEHAIGALRYGAVGVNAFPGMIFAYGSPPWGAYPGSSLTDVQSGIGWVHNTAMLEGIEKAVLWHPLTTWPKPAYHLTKRATNVLVRRMTALEERGSWTRVPGVVAAAV